MERLIRCDCGHVVRSSDESEVLARARRHAAEAHGIDFTLEQARSLAIPADWEVRGEEGHTVSSG